MKKETIYLAGGCFWGTEHYMKTIDGVLETKVGYALGEKPLWNPPLRDHVTYEEVCNRSGHAETVGVIFDAEI
ncbi:MAG: peptide-methionine (S)-S-oxide reductase, partial [Anaerotignum sp.]|nr:peptide-methionine (S)-S-oxide reductase [Anaerotignum sp.]